MCISHNCFKFALYELLKFHRISKSNTRCSDLHVATITLLWLATFIQTQKHKLTPTYCCNFSKDRKTKNKSNCEKPGPQNLIHVKFKFFNENVRSKKASGQIKRNKLKYLHYLKKWLKNARWACSFSVKFHASGQQHYLIQPFHGTFSKFLPRLWIAAFAL